MIEAIIKDRWNRYHSERSDRSEREFLLNWYSPAHPYWRKSRNCSIFRLDYQIVLSILAHLSLLDVGKFPNQVILITE